MVLNENLKEGLAKAFGIEVLSSGLRLVENKTQNVSGEFVIDPIWVAQLRGQYWGEVIISIAHLRTKGGSQKTKMGVLLVSDHWQNQRLLGTNPFRSVNLGDVSDPVSEALKNINMLSVETSIITDSGPLPRFRLTTYSGNLWGYFNYSSYGVMQDESITRLWQGLLSTVKTLAQAYNDVEINAFFDRDRSRLG